MSENELTSEPIFASLLVIVNAASGELVQARELGTEEATDPARYALNEAWELKKPIICVVVEPGGKVTSARAKVPNQNPFQGDKTKKAPPPKRRGRHD